MWNAVASSNEVAITKEALPDDITWFVVKAGTGNDETGNNKSEYEMGTEIL